MLEKIRLQIKLRTKYMEFVVMRNVNFVILFFLVFSFQHAHASSNCTAMADMAYQVASIRDAGVPRNNIETRLKREIRDGKELSFALMVVTLVYNAEGSPLALKQEVLRQCNSKSK